MYKTTFFFILAIMCCSLSILAQRDSLINIGHVDVIQSKILNEKREIMVHVPPNISKTYSFPVMIVFDGDALFTKTIGIIGT